VGTDFSVLDLVGLGDSFTAHLAATPSMKEVFAGHEKRLPPPWLVARVTRPEYRPDAKQFPSYFTPMIPPTTGTAFEEQVAWARAALKCPAIARLEAAAEAPMTPRRFASNFLHAFSNSRVRIPPDPEEAYHKFCGPETPPEVLALR
jgi:arabinofuranosyltransferase